MNFYVSNLINRIDTLRNITFNKKLNILYIESNRYDFNH